MVLGFLSRMMGSEPAKSPHVASAEGSFTKEELQALKDHFQAALRAQGTSQHVLQEDAFVQLLCGLPKAGAGGGSCLEQPGLVGAAMYHACCGGGEAPQSDQSGPAVPTAAASGVSLHDVVVAKAACERMPTSDSHAFAFKLLCHIAVLASLQTASGNNAPAAAAAAPASAADHTEAQPQHQQQQQSASKTSVAHTSQSFIDTGIPLEALEQCLSAVCALLNVHGHLTAVTGSDMLKSQSETQSRQASAAQPPVGAADKQQAEQHHQGQLSALHDWVAAAAQGALWAAAGPASTQPATSLTMDGYSRWVKAMPIWDTVLTSLLSQVGKQQAVTGMSAGAAETNGAAAAARSGASAAQLLVPAPLLPTPPRLLTSTVGGAADARTAATAADLLLHPLAALLLSGSMPASHRVDWRLLFSSDRDGKSFNTLMGRLGAVEGATLMLVKESGEGGHLVAGYAPAPWRKSGSYFGDHTTWVARLQPDLQVYTATGLNTNFQWCGVGFSQLTNGLGFGGAQGTIPAFALLVDSTLDNGQSRPIATFGSPSLTHSQTFGVASVECWLVQPPEEDPSNSSNSKKATSVLQKAGADRVIMGLAGMKVDHSAGIKDEPLEED